MLFSAPWKNLFRTCPAILFVIAGCLVLFLFSPSSAHAQVISQQPQSSSYNAFNTPNTDPDVPQNQHYFAQTTMIEVLSAVFCQLTGIDPENPSVPCLGIDTKTNKIGFVPNQQNGSYKIGGLLGDITTMTAVLYTPTISSGSYFQYLSDNFGIVKKAEAQTTGTCTGGVGIGYGICSLQPILTIWVASRNIAYFLFVFAFMLIGLGIMLRLHIDPRTVMTVQNQIPRIIICILLITFSYAIAGLMIDAMWVVTYVVINQIAAVDPNITVNFATTNTKLAQSATNNLLDTPFSYISHVFSDGLITYHFPVGFTGLGPEVANSFANVIQSVILSFFGQANGTTSCISGLVPPQVNFGGCFGDLAKFLAGIIGGIIIVCALLVTMFRLWFELLKAYVSIIIEVISAPLFIVMGLLPGKPLGFEKWIRSLFVNLVTFPIVAAMFVLARVLKEIFDKTTNNDPKTTFIPPLVGDPNMKDFGALIAFGIILMTPAMLNLMRDAMKVKHSPHLGAITSGIASGAAVAAALPNKSWANLNRRDEQGRPVGLGARLVDNITSGVLMRGGKLPLIGRPLVNQAQRIKNRMYEGHFATDAQLRPRQEADKVAKYEKFKQKLAEQKQYMDQHHVNQYQSMTDDQKKEFGKPYSPDNEGYKQFLKDEKLEEQAQKKQQEAAKYEQRSVTGSSWWRQHNKDKAERLKGEAAELLGKKQYKYVPPLPQNPPDLNRQQAQPAAHSSTPPQTNPAADRLWELMQQNQRNNPTQRLNPQTPSQNNGQGQGGQRGGGGGQHNPS